MSVNKLWQVESIRFTLLEVSSGAERELTVEKIFGLPPDSRVEKPAQRVLAEELVWNEMNVSLSLQPSRVDIIFNPVPSFPGVPSLGEFHAAMEKAAKALPVISQVSAKRLAMGLALTLPQPSKVDSYQLLDKLLLDVSLSADDSDFMYQINKPVSSESVNGVMINRIFRWSSMVYQSFTMSVGGDSPAIEEDHAVRLELDLNTAPTTPVAHLEDGSKLFGELMAIAESAMNFPGELK